LLIFLQTLSVDFFLFNFVQNYHSVLLTRPMTISEVI